MHASHFFPKYYLKYILLIPIFIRINILISILNKENVYIFRIHSSHFYLK